MDEIAKNSTLVIEHKTFDKGAVYGKYFNGTLERNNYVMEPGKNVQVKFSDDFCTYDILVKNPDYVPEYRISAGYDPKKDTCSVSVPVELQRYVTQSAVKNDSYVTDVNVSIVPYPLVAASCFLLFLLGILLMNRYLDKRNKYLDLDG